MFSQFANVLNASLPHETQYSLCSVQLEPLLVAKASSSVSACSDLPLKLSECDLMAMANLLLCNRVTSFLFFFFPLAFFLVRHKAKCKSNGSDAKPNRMHSCCN